jgi:hypothetical protein
MACWQAIGQEIRPCARGTQTRREDQCDGREWTRSPGARRHHGLLCNAWSKPAARIPKAHPPRRIGMAC